MHHHLTEYLRHLTALNEETIRATLAATQGAAKDLPASAPPPPQVQDSSFACQCTVWRKGPCPHPKSPMANSQTKYPKDEANPDGPKCNFKFSDQCRKEYQKSIKANKPKVPRKRAASTAVEKKPGAVATKKPTPVSDVKEEDEDDENEGVPEQYEEEEQEEGNGLDL